MAELNPNTIGRLKFGARAISGILTPPSGQLLVAAESANGHIVQKDSAGKLIDLAAVDSQEDSVGFDCTALWTFEAGTESWTVANGTIAFDSSNGKGILVTDTSSVTTTILTSPSGLTIDGTKYRRVKMSITLVTPGTLPANTPNFQYVTGGHGFSASFRRIIPYPVPFSAANDTVILDFDMENLVDGGTDWQTTNPITQIRVSLTDATTTGMVVRVNWVAVGRNAPPQRSIQFKDEGVAVSSAGYIKNVDFTGNVTATASGDTLTVNVPAGAGSGDVSQSANSSASGKLKISAAADKTITDYAGTSALLKVNASSILANAVAGTDYFPPATNAGVDSNDLILLDSASPATPSSGVKLLAQAEVGISAFRTLNKKGQNWRVRPEGRFTARFQAAANSNLLTGHQGLLFSATGTATAVAAANTSRYTRTSRVEALVTTAATTAVAGFRVANSAIMFTGSGTVDGGYWMQLIGGPATGVATTTSRYWMGTGQTTAPTDAEPSSITNAIGAGYDAADTNIQIMTRGSGAVVKTDTGIAVPTTDRAALYEIIIYQPPGSTQEAYIQFTDLINGTVFSKTETTAGNIPATGISLVPKIYSSVGGTSSVIGVALASCFVTSDF